MISHFFFLILLIATASMDCKDGCTSCDSTSNTCYVCKSSELARINDGKCISITQLVDNCAIYSPDNKCTTCNPTYKNVNGKCQKDQTGCLLFIG